MERDPVTPVDAKRAQGVGGPGDLVPRLRAPGAAAVADVAVEVQGDFDGWQRLAGPFGARRGDRSVMWHAA
ncbi:hypothetical protein AB0C76_01925 [Kitasatospora sp. NPDC048722]|uniref:hypothetical protein n=1 Tax=Kitasatospora sp. NPDC048722 TaxID=3155639 RepID=UPI0033DCDC1E